MKFFGKSIEQNIEGVYQYEGDTIIVSIQDGKVIATNQDGVQVPPMEVVLSGRKLSQEGQGSKKRLPSPDAD